MPIRVSGKSRWTLSLPTLFAVAYASVVYYTALRHEPWADEAQAWLIARDSSLPEIWAKILPLEGTPGLWHSLLHLLIRAGLPYGALNLVSGTLGLAGAVVVFRFAPFPAPVRFLLPFTYFLCYQYSVVARNYSLTPVLLFGAAACLRANRRRAMAICLVLLAAVSAQSYIVSLSFGLAVAVRGIQKFGSFEPRKRREVMVVACLYLAALALIAWAVWPARNATFVLSPNWSTSNFLGMSRYGFGQAFGSGVWAIVVLLLSLPLLLQGSAWMFFVVATLGLSAFGAVVYSNVWHHGFLILTWVTAQWIGYRSGLFAKLSMAALAATIVLQSTWTYQAIRYDSTHAYSGSRKLARLLQREHLEAHNIVGVNFPATAIQPYFPRSVYSNFMGEHGSEQAFWHWSRDNAAHDAAEQLGDLHPDYVVLGYSAEADGRLWAHLIRSSGYGELARSDGEIYWRDRPFQHESFTLYKRERPPSDSSLASELGFMDSEKDIQLIWGFSGAPNQAGRVVSDNAGIFLQRPTRMANHDTLHFEMAFTVSDEQLRHAGPRTLCVYVCGHRLTVMPIDHAGSYLYEGELTVNDVFWSVVPVALQFQKKDAILPYPASSNIAVVTAVRLFAE